MDVSIIIVNYNTKSLLENCLDSVFKKTDGISYEVIVSDNGSTDGSSEMVQKKFPKVILIENNENLGFGKANNCACARACGKYIFYLNSDTILLNNAVKLFYDYFEAHKNESVGALGCNLVDQHFNLTHSYGNFPCYHKEVAARVIDAFKLLVKRFIHMLGKTYCKKNQSSVSFYTGPVDYIIGADLFVKNDNFALFDERFFLYYEETDMQLAMAHSGLERRIIDGPRIQHFCNVLGTFTNDLDRAKSFSKIQSDKSALLYFKKNLLHGKKCHCMLLTAAVHFGWHAAGVKI